MNKTFKSSEVDGNGKCKTRKSHSGLSIKRGTSRDWKYDRATIVKDLITKMLVEKQKPGYIINKDKISIKLKEEFLKLPFETKQTAIDQAKNYVDLVYRYVECEKKQLLGYDLPVEYLELPNGDNISVKPDFIFKGTILGRSVVEVVKLSCSSKPSKFNKPFEESLLAWYGEKFVEHHGLDEPQIYVSSYYFLRSSSDNKDWSDNFFGSSTRYSRRNFHTCKKIDLTGLINDFVKGIEEDDCTKEDCERCELYEICKAKKPPIACDEKVEVSAKELITSLSKEQRQAIKITDGIWRINAVAGAGKTLVICLRAAYLLSVGVSPKDIILLTFTEKAAEEMKARVSSYAKTLGVKDDLSSLHCQTFHSYGNDIIAKHYKELGFSKEPRLIDMVEQKRIVAGLLEGDVIEGLDYRNFTMDLPFSKGALATTLHILEKIKNDNLVVSNDKDIETLLKEDVVKRITGDKEKVIRRLFGVYEKYNEVLKTLNLIDYIDQESVLLKLSISNPFVFEDLGFKHVIIDEFQDVNETQFKIIKGLANNTVNKSLMVVGDDLQSIYAFRGAMPEYIVKFYEHLGLEGEDINLLSNYRSSRDVIDYANSIIDGINIKVDKKIIPTKEYGEDVSFKSFDKKKDEPVWIADEIEKMIKSGKEKEDIAVITFTGSELLKIGDELSKRNIEWNLYNPEKYMDNSKCMGAISLARLYKDTNDTSAALCYLNAKLNNDLLKLFSDKAINSQIEELIKKIEKVKQSKSPKRFMTLIKEIGLEDEIFESFYNILENHSSSLDTLIKYISDFELYGENERKKREKKYPGVILTTAHSSKGLEFNIVFNSISEYEKKGTNRSADEVMRLFFTSVTRAKEKLIVTTKTMQNKDTSYGFGHKAYSLFKIAKDKKPKVS